jgi:capsular exopolysaccharide synthesis family protein
LPAGASQSDEAFRSLRTNLMFAAHAEGVRTLVVTSAFPQEGKSVTASRLARAFAHQGVRTLLVDGDLRRPTLHTILGVAQAPGLSEVLRGAPLDLDSIRCAASPNLYLLPAGSTAVDAGELLANDRMRNMIGAPPEGLELVIVDSPPLLSAADASALSAKADAVLVVVRAGRTARGALRQAVNQLETVGARIAGIVLNDPDTKVSRYSDYYAAYGYYAAQADLRPAAPSPS